MLVSRVKLGLGKKKYLQRKTFTVAYTEYQNLKALEDKFNLCSGSIRRLCREYDIEVVKPWRSTAEIRLFEELNDILILYGMHPTRRLSIHTNWTLSVLNAS
jgi:hypothetical protein